MSDSPTFDPQSARATPPNVVMERGACRGVKFEVFYPEAGGQYGQAQRICTACPVRAECLVWAVETRQMFGMFGGLTPRERRALMKRKKPKVQVEG